jgi:outer membrane usher protein
MAPFAGRWLLALALAAAAFLAHAGYEPLILDLTVNQQRRGEFTLFRDDDGEFYVKLDDLPALGLTESAARGQVLRVGSVAIVPLRSLGPQDLRFDEKRLVLELTLAPGLLLKKEFDLAPRRPEKAAEPRDSSAFVNYRVSAAGDDSSAPLRLAVATELALRSGPFLLRHESMLRRENGNVRGVRFATQLVHDARETQQRFILGDHTATSGELGSTLAVGGLSFAKAYQLAPYMIRQPLAGFAGTVSTPSQVEVRVAGATVFREQVGPGPFELRNIAQFGGARDVEVVVRDALGREQSLGFPYYFSDQSLRAGLHDYNYSVGALRQDLGVRSNRYGPLVLSASHRYGLSDRLTVGVRGEAAPGLWNLGPSLLYRDDRFGVFSASVAASEHDGRRGLASSFGYLYQSPRVSLRALGRRYSDGYAIAQDRVAPSMLRAEHGAGATFTQPGWGALSIDRTVTERRSGATAVVPDGTVTRVGYSHSLGASGSLFTSFSRLGGTRRSSEFFVGVLITLDRTQSLNLSSRRDPNGSATHSAQLVKAVPLGEGFGYRVRAETTRPGGGERVAPFVQYNARTASYTLDGEAVSSSSAGAKRLEAAVAGALTRVGGQWDATRQISDSFVAVQLGAPVPGVRVYSNNQEIGRTDATGRLVVPHVGSYYETQIAIDEKDVPLEYTIGELRRLIAPAFRSGSQVAFDVRRLRAVEGLIRVPARGARVPADSLTGQLQAGAQTIEFTTARDGRYYIENLPPGRYDATLAFEGKECRITLNVPESTASIAELPPVNACE